MVQSDFLVIGSGIAGLMYALEVADLGRVIVLCKADPLEGNTRYAQGGIASVTAPTDSFDAHVADTLRAGDGLCNPEIVELVVSQGPRCIDRLIELGTHFDKIESSDDYELGQEGGHSARRILHARDATGAEILRAVYERAQQHPNIKIYSDRVGLDFIVERRGEKLQALGAYALNKTTGIVETYAARMTLLATGGMGKVYLYTSNPDVATGDGVAMAYRAGARIGNMEFIQFHPTCLYHPRAKSFLITEAMRGEGALLKDVRGFEFMPLYSPERELAPRDIVARAIDDHMKKKGDDYVLLDITHRDPNFIRHRFPTIYERVKKFGFDITTEPIPVVPAAHYCCGGVVTDSWARTNIEGLFAAGEVACTGLHGANRLASNSLLEAVFFAMRAAELSRDLFAADSAPAKSPVKEWDTVGSVQSSEEVFVSYVWDEVRRLMWNLVGIVRTDRRLVLAKRRIDLIREEIRNYYWRFSVTSDLIEARNIVDVADLVICCAMQRGESRGLHYNLDHPEHSAEPPHDTFLERPRS